MSPIGRRSLSTSALLVSTALVWGGLPHSTATATPGEDRLTRAAKANEVSVTKLQSLLRDPAAELGAGGRLLYADPEPALAPAPALALASAQASVATASVPLSQTFQLHSKPGSQHTIYLDVDGTPVTGTAWNVGMSTASSDDLPSGNYPGWDPARNGAAFTDPERVKLQEVWARVAEDFAPFDVDVTTQDPGAAAIDRSGAGDSAYGTRVLISDSAVAESVICGTCGGVAYYDVFDDPTSHARYQPAWVFPDNLFSSKAVAEAVSHEVGHTFGLDHDGPGYEPGHDSWAPIMGASYYRPISQWSRGDYSGATNREDDVSMIAANGAPLRADEAGATTATAARVPTGTAYISHRSDRDVYALGECTGGLMVIDATPANVSPNLDIQLRLLGAAGNQVLAANPLSSFVSDLLATGLGASIARVVPAGTYFVEVDGVGRGAATTSYDDYGSIGAYRLSAPGCSSSPPGTNSDLDPSPLLRAPSAGRIGKATSGQRGGASTAKIAWSAPLTTGGSELSGFQVKAFRKRNGSFRYADATNVLPAGSRTTTLRLRPGTYKFAVRARNGVGWGPLSSKSTSAVAR